MIGNLPKPIKKQREVLNMPATSHSAVLGTAGSGTTTLALYRAAYLSETSIPHAGKTLLLTLNKALVTYLKYLKPTELRNVQIETNHTFAQGYLNVRGKMWFNCICSDPDERRGYISRAVKAVESGYEPSKFFKRSIEFFMDDIQWIFSHGITSSDEYVKVDRVGRIGTNLSRKLRPVMYENLEKYVNLHNQTGNMYDWDDLALHVRKECEDDNSTRMYKHIVIDEGQDFSPEMIRSLAAAIPEDGSLSLGHCQRPPLLGYQKAWGPVDLCEGCAADVLSSGHSVCCFLRCKGTRV